MAITHYYVDPAAGTAGDGSIGDPWGSVQQALDTITQNATDGDQINVKEGTDDVLSAALDFSSYGAPNSDVPLVIRGYTSAANDGGIGGVSGNSSVAIVGGFTIDGLFCIDMHFHSCGNNHMFEVDEDCRFYNCEINGATGHAISCDLRTSVVSCYLHDVTHGVFAYHQGAVAYCYVTDCSAYGIYGGLSSVHHNIVTLSQGAGIVCGDYGAIISHNSVYSTSATTTGISPATSSNACHIMNNLVEGFQWGISIPSNRDQAMIIGNSVYNALTADYVLANTVVDEENESLGSSPFAKSGSDTFANRAAYFAALDVGDVFNPAGGIYGLRGAVQQDASASSGGTPKLVGIGGLAG